MGRPEDDRVGVDKDPEKEKIPSNIFLYCGTSDPSFARKVARLLHTNVEAPVHPFSDGEAHVLLPSPLGYDTFPFVLQSTRPLQTAKFVNEVTLMLDAINRSSGAYRSHVTVVIPYFGYARADKKHQSRAALGAKVISKQIEAAGAGRIMSIDIHNEAIAGFVDIPWDFLHASQLFIPLLQREQICGPELCVFSTDFGGGKPADAYRKRLGGYTTCTVFKERDPDKENCTKSVCLLRDDDLPVGFVEGRDVLIVDDMIDTAGSMIQAVEIARTKGARNVFTVATHGTFTGGGANRMKSALDSGLVTHLFVTDTVPQTLLRHPNRTVVSVVPLVAEYIRRTASGQSLGELVGKLF